MTEDDVIDLGAVRAVGTPWRDAHALARSTDYPHVFRSVLLHRSVAQDPHARARAVALVLPVGLGGPLLARQTW